MHAFTDHSGLGKSMKTVEAFNRGGFVLMLLLLVGDLCQLTKSMGIFEQDIIQSVPPSIWVVHSWHKGLVYLRSDWP
jgi:hypothetical protein